MTDTQVQEGNKLIAEFMQHYKEYMKDTPTYGSYHEQWDWLMPVVEKIASLNYEVDISTHYGIEVSERPMQSIFAVDDDLTLPLIKQVWLTVVQFIQWYNQTNSK